MEASTTGADGSDGAPLLRPLWTPERILTCIQEFTARYGRPPMLVDWSPGAARRRGRPDLAERYYRDGCWPHASTVRKLFGSWRRALDEAGHPELPRGGAVMRARWHAKGLVTTTDIAEMAGVDRFAVRRPLGRSGIRPAETHGRTSLYRREDAEVFVRRLREALEERNEAVRSRRARNPAD
jgi:hypothetical protein